MRKISLSLLVFLFLQTSVHAASVWKVSKGDKHVFVGGTVHLLSASDYPLPGEYEKAYKQSASVVFETDMAAISSQQFQMKTMQQMTYSDGTTLKDVLSQSTFSALEKHMQSRNVPLQNMLIFKPSLMYLTLSVLELQRMGLTSEGVDMYFSTKASGDGKQQNWLESPDQQLAFLKNIGSEDPDGLIAYTLSEMDEMPTLVGQLKTHWRSGDMKKLAAVGIEQLRSDYPQIYADLIKTRNNNWLPQIENMVANEGVEFILVGALHLAGPDSVLTMLEHKGYKIEKL